MILQELGLSGPSELDRLRNQALLRAIVSTTRENRQDELRVSNQLTESRMNWTCYLCHKQCSLDNIDELSQCMHKYCSQCAQAYLKYKINAKEEVYCPEISCGEPIAKTSQHFINLTADFRRRFEQNELASKQLKSNPSLMLCKRYQCNAQVEISPEGPIVCKKCETIHCRKCREASHVNGCKYLQPLFLDAGHNPEEALPPPQLLKLKQAAAIQAAKALQPHPGSPIDSVVALIPIAASKASQQGKSQPNTQQPTAVSSQANQPNTLVVSQVVRVPDGPLGVSPIIPLPNNNMMAPITETRILAPGVSHVMDAGANPVPPVLGGAPMADAATNRQSPARDSAPVPTKCTAMNIVLWILLPLSIIITVVALLFVLLLEVFFAVGKSVFTFIKGNFAKSKSKSSWWTALLVVTFPFQVLAGIFGAYFILKKEESYKFGLYLKKTFLFLEKLYPLQVRHCLNKTSATST